MLAVNDAARLYLLASLVSKEGVLSKNAKCLLKEEILKRSEGAISLLEDSSRVVEVVHSAASRMMHSIYTDCPLELAKALSKSERGSSTNKSLIYGEVDFDSFAKILRGLPVNTGKFCDLGSGSGRAVFIARILHDFDECVGVEILHNLHRASASLRLPADVLSRESLGFVRASFLDYDWSDADVAFANSTCFEDDLMDALSDRAERLKPGAILVTFTRSLNSNAPFDLLQRERYKMSWGPATVFVHARKHANGDPFYAGGGGGDEGEDGVVSNGQRDALLTRDRDLEIALDEEEEEEEDDDICGGIAAFNKRTTASGIEGDFEHLEPLVADLIIS